MSLIDNIVDIHVHADPSLFERNCNTQELIEKCSNCKAYYSIRFVGFPLFGCPVHGVLIILA